MTFVEDINLGSFGCSAIIMTDNVTVDLVNNAAQSGIRRVMNVNIGNEEFLNTVKSIVGNEKKLNQNFNVTKKVRSRVYAFFSGKGGVGKTTICTNTAVYLATLGKKVLLVDLDLQFHHVATGGRAHHTGAHGVVAFFERADIAGVFVMINHFVAVCHDAVSLCG